MVRKLPSWRSRLSWRRRNRGSTAYRPCELPTAATADLMSEHSSRGRPTFDRKFARLFTGERRIRTSRTAAQKPWVSAAFRAWQEIDGAPKRYHLMVRRFFFCASNHFEPEPGWGMVCGLLRCAVASSSVVHSASLGSKGGGNASLAEASGT